MKSATTAAAAAATSLALLPALVAGLTFPPWLSPRGTDHVAGLRSTTPLRVSGLDSVAGRHAGHELAGGCSVSCLEQTCGAFDLGCLCAGGNSTYHPVSQCIDESCLSTEYSSARGWVDSVCSSSPGLGLGRIASGVPTGSIRSDSSEVGSLLTERRIGCETGSKTCGKHCIPDDGSCCEPGQGIYCESGNVCCGDNFCNPVGTQCCSENHYCNTGYSCCYDGCVETGSTCCPADQKVCGTGCIEQDEVCCDNGDKYCAAGQSCTSDGNCCDGDKKVCGSGCVGADQTCCTNQETSCPSDQQCCNDSCISQDETCCADGQKSCGGKCIGSGECCDSSGAGNCNESTDKPADGTEEAEAATTDEVQGGLSTGAKAGIGVGVTFGVLFVLGLIAFVLWKKRNHQDQDTHRTPGGPAEAAPSPQMFRAVEDDDDDDERNNRWSQMLPIQHPPPLEPQETSHWGGSTTMSESYGKTPVSNAGNTLFAPAPAHQRFDQVPFEPQQAQPPPPPPPPPQSQPGYYYSPLQEPERYIPSPPPETYSPPRQQRSVPDQGQYPREKPRDEVQWPFSH